jgi:prepilin-type N-terminal cleavage/methylation domain-containing protein
MTKSQPSIQQLGFTIVELMMSLAILTVGISGIIAMQKVTAASNLHSKSVAIATQIANSWQDQLLVDGSIWRSATGGLAGLPVATTWLANANTPNVWFQPQYIPGREFGAAFDALGNPVADANVAQAQFCVHLLFVPVVALTNIDNATVRATVRVLWPRAQASQTATVNFCAPGNNPATIAQATDKYHSLYQTFAIRVRP